uniref:Uncharacterized protein n=1 Tax=Arundo donax TaxID=35708 RepID=A0A0A9GJJ9_ARUDO
MVVVAPGAGGVRRPRPAPEPAAAAGGTACG